MALAVTDVSLEYNSSLARFRPLAFLGMSGAEARIVKIAECVYVFTGQGMLDAVDLDVIGTSQDFRDVEIDPEVSSTANVIVALTLEAVRDLCRNEYMVSST